MLQSKESEDPPGNSSLAADPSLGPTLALTHSITESMAPLNDGATPISTNEFNDLALDDSPLLPSHDESIQLDAAAGLTNPIAPDVESRAAPAADPTVPIEKRVEAFEDLMDSEIGDTSLSRARNIERTIGLRQLYLKFEGGNPTGTQKDRIAFAQAMDALRRGYTAMTLATCGNYGAAAGLAASLAGLRCYVYIPASYRTRRIAEIERTGAILIRTNGDYENAVELSRQHARKDELYDANPGGDNTALQLMAYGSIAYEIYDELRDAPAAVAVSVSNGTTLAGLYRGFLSLYRRGKTSRIPRMIAGSSHNKNPIVYAFRHNLLRCDDLRPKSIRETKVNEPLVNWHAVDGEAALEALRATHGIANDASDKEMSTLSKSLRSAEGLDVLPAATAGLHALIELHRESNLPSDRYVVVLTGRKG
ncbi:MAG TPA: pyridoxal-phosphate dependent enzyme [Polyangiaceae bacterium]|jgi:threonine synthase|nr:MAG: Threonine synthase [Deltaproteobacteria bacterium ADurb.Bin207]HNS97168.1 pyridoxal-phosphate dependent enzyme [Polyangiaceae bacterium]HNZ23550.1 pyridoxal-phosphate dependent enzyme [Polyangiaceae bacterium]HOD24216.1 pyridoxal-phosphate dependent enzyme [Polyangiaceae bacterium]HOE51452.1 pyridoxal-phosphate dependent enzyme [Polyangiaceae bacterium]